MLNALSGALLNAPIKSVCVKLEQRLLQRFRPVLRLAMVRMFHVWLRRGAGRSVRTGITCTFLIGVLITLLSKFGEQRFLIKKTLIYQCNINTLWIHSGQDSDLALVLQILPHTAYAS